MDWEYVFVIPFQFFALCITIHDASCAAFMDGAALVLQLCGSRSSHCCFRAGHVPSGAFSSYLIDTFKRKSVCFIAIFLFVASSLLYPYVATVGFSSSSWSGCPGRLFSVITMTTGSTLVIDVTASAAAQDANIAFACLGGSFWNGGGSCLGDLCYPYWNFHHIIYTSMALGVVGAGADSGGESSFRAPLSTSSWFSLDRFAAALWPGMNMMMVAIIFEIVIVHIYNELFCLYPDRLCTCALFALRAFSACFRSFGGRALGQAAMIGGLLCSLFQ